jgi:SAM-dependent methyltransferase
MWQVDIAVHTVKVLLPFRAQLRALKRRVMPSAESTENHLLAFEQGLEQITALRGCGFKIEGSDVLDLGSGWNPIVPLLFLMAGARCVHLTDLDRLIDGAAMVETMGFLRDQQDEIVRRLDIDRHRAESVLSPVHGMGLDALLDRTQLTYTVPFDSAVQMPSVDLVMSRTVLEHIKPPALRRLLADFGKGLRPGGMMSHVIDHSDHREHRDKSLSRIDFLRYSDRVWRCLCVDPQDYTNRLRHTDYLEMIRKAGYDIIFERREVDACAVADAARLPLWGRFREMSPDVVGTLTSHIVAHHV